MILTAKLKKVAMIAVAVIVVFVLGALSGGMLGWSYCKSSQKSAVIKQQEKDANEVLKHEDKKDAAEQKIRDIIRKRVKTAIDPSGCLDRNSPDDYLNGLFDAENAAKSGFD